MKHRLSSAAGVAALTLLLTWAVQQEVRLVELRSIEESLRRDAERLGISLGRSGELAGRGRQRESREAKVERISHELMRLVQEMTSLSKAPTRGQDAAIKIRSEIDQLLSEATFSEALGILDRILTTDDLEEPGRRFLLSFVVSHLAKLDARGALAALAERERDLPQSLFSYPGPAAEALRTWTNEDPKLAWEWIRSRGDDSPWFARQLLHVAARAAAATEPGLAFEMLAAAGWDGASEHVALVLMQPQRPEDRAAAMELLREQVRAGETEEAAVLTRLGMKFRDWKFEDASRWMTEAALSPDELAAIAERLDSRQTTDDSGRWISYLAGQLPDEQLARPVENLMRQWTQSDYLAAGHWLAAAPDDAAKPHAVRAYATTVTPYDPETAEQWALTLPPGEDREATLGSIFNRWPEDDPVGKRGFAERHGIDN